MLSGKVAVITGGSSGIGAALARLLAPQGATIVLGARRKDRLDQLAAQIRSEVPAAEAVDAVRCDVTRREDAEALIHGAVRRHGRIDILVNNAGRGHLASVEETTDEMLFEMFAVNVYALWYTTRPALRYMKKQNSGHIINIASMAGKLGFPLNSAYVAAKHACVGFTHALRMELAETGIHASVVCPAGVLTDWASSTLGGPMLPLFSASGPIAKRIAAERGIELPPMEGVIPPERVAQAILECIHSPVAEVYTQRGAHAFVVRSAQQREDAERSQIPVALAERSVYEKMKGK